MSIQGSLKGHREKLGIKAVPKIEFWPEDTGILEACPC